MKYMIVFDIRYIQIQSARLRSWYISKAVDNKFDFKIPFFLEKWEILKAISSSSFSKNVVKIIHEDEYMENSLPYIRVYSE